MAVLTVVVAAAFPPHVPTHRPSLQSLAALDEALVLQETETTTATRSIAEVGRSVDVGECHVSM